MGRRRKKTAAGRVASGWGRWNCGWCSPGAGEEARGDGGAKDGPLIVKRISRTGATGRGNRQTCAF